MKKLTKYTLNKDKATEYLFWNLEDLNLLSKLILKHLDFNTGQFYTYLNKGLNHEDIHRLKTGKMGAYVQSKITADIEEILKNNTKLSVIHDNFEEDYNEQENWNLYEICGVHHQKEMYYFLDHKKLENNSLSKAVKASSVIWHSLIIISDYKMKFKNSDELIDSELKKYVEQTLYLFCLAYDGEGYIIWKKDEKIN